MLWWCWRWWLWRCNAILSFGCRYFHKLWKFRTSDLTTVEIVCMHRLILIRQHSDLDIYQMWYRNQSCTQVSGQYRWQWRGPAAGKDVSHSQLGTASSQIAAPNARGIPSVLQSFPTAPLHDPTSFGLSQVGHEVTANNADRQIRA